MSTLTLVVVALGCLAAGNIWGYMQGWVAGYWTPHEGDNRCPACDGSGVLS